MNATLVGCGPADDKAEVSSRAPSLFDGRYLFEPDLMNRHGIQHRCVSQTSPR
jgi:hypothetical protein